MADNKERLTRYVRYQQLVKDMLTGAIPGKHEGHPETYRQHLQRELELVNAKIDALKLEGVKNGN